MFLDVAGCDGEGGAGNVGGDNGGFGGVCGYGDGDAAAAGAEVADELGGSAGPEELDGALDEELGFGAGDQAIARNLKLERVEFGLSGEICDGFMLGGSFYEFAQAVEVVLGDEVVKVGVELDAF